MNKINKYKTEISERRILSVQINLLNKCTSKCVYCRKYTWPNDVLDIEVLERCIRYLHGQGLQTIVFSGGDPILYPHIKRLINYCNDLNIQTSIITTLITNDTDLLEFLAKNVTRIHCSVDSTDEEIYSKLRGVNGLHIVKRNIKNVNDIRINFGKIPIRISSTISNKNYGEVYSLYEFAKFTNSTINYYFIHEHEEFFMNEEDKLNFTNILNTVKDDDVDVITNANSILLEIFSNKTCNVRSKICTIPYIHCLINANGDIYPCCKLLNDNGVYDKQCKYVYGNIYNCNLEKEFSNRFKSYNIENYCNGCEERYINLIDDVNAIIGETRLFL